MRKGWQCIHVGAHGRRVCMWAQGAASRHASSTQDIQHGPGKMLNTVLTGAGFVTGAGCHNTEPHVRHADRFVLAAQKPVARCGQLITPLAASLGPHRCRPPAARRWRAPRACRIRAPPSAAPAPSTPACRAKQEGRACGCARVCINHQAAGAQLLSLLHHAWPWICHGGGVGCPAVLHRRVAADRRPPWVNTCLD